MGLTGAFHFTTCVGFAFLMLLLWGVVFGALHREKEPENNSLFHCRRLPPVTACSTPSNTMHKYRACRDTRCPYSKIKVTKISLNNSLDKFPPLILKNMIYIYIIILIHIQSYVHLYIYIFRYLFHYYAKSIPVANKLVSSPKGNKQMLIVLN